LEDKASFSGLLNNLFFKSLKFLGHRLLKTFFFFEAVNIHQVPSIGPFIITANHFSFMDPPVLQAGCPRRIHFLMTEKYYNPIWGRWFFRLMRAIPVRENTAYNIGPVKIGLEILKHGNVVGIFPEGGISKTGIIQDGRPGTLLLAQKSKVSILPVFISGTYLALPKHAKFFRKANIKVIFGNPITYEELSRGIKGKKGLEEATKNLIKKISDLSQKDQ
jgi:1-acyl-sn-glycerol-3-phosphate acyltransferase